MQKYVIFKFSSIESIVEYAARYFVANAPTSRYPASWFGPTAQVFHMFKLLRNTANDVLTWFQVPRFRVLKIIYFKAIFERARCAIRLWLKWRLATLSTTPSLSKSSWSDFRSPHHRSTVGPCIHSALMTLN